MQLNESKYVILPFYLPDQYPLLLVKVDDPETLEEKWEEWYNSYTDFKSKMKKLGIKCLEIIVDVDELNTYCVMNEVKNIEATRNLFARKLYDSLMD
jgi:hypothetical protein